MRDTVDVACPSDRPVRCSGECVGDTDSNPLRCGATCTRCEVPAHGSATCTRGTCGIECAAGYVAMGTACIDAPAPRPVRPLTNARVSVTQPTLRWANPDGATRAHITICRDRACTSVVTEFDAEGTTARVPNDLGPGVWFWNLRAIDRGVTSAARSATRSFHTPAVSGPVEWSWAERPDYNGDGIDDLTADYPTADGLMRTEVFLGGHSIDAAGQRIGMHRMQPVGDVDGDGFSDFVSINRPSATIFAGGSDMSALRTIQSVTDSTIMGLDYFGWGASFGDFDGDGFGDALLLGGPAYVVAHGSPTGWTRFEPVPGPASLAIMFDANADGFDDVVSADRWWRGGSELGDAQMFAPRAFGLVVFPMGDLDGDGYLDAVQLADDEPMVLLRGSTAGPVAVVDAASPLGGQRPPFGDAGDLDGDGIDDLLYWVQGEHSVAAYRGTTDGYSHSNMFAPMLPCTLGTFDSMPRSHRIGDFDGSGHEDFALVCRTAGEVFLHLDANTPAARWVPLRAPQADVIE